MPPTPRPSRPLNPRTAALLAAGALIVAALIAAAIMGRVHAPGGLPTERQTVTLAGQLICLPHKNPNGPQTEECAYGLKDDAGRYYGLNDTSGNYSLISSAEFNHRVQVTGTFHSQTSATYPIAGIINVTGIKQE
jgi:hypothetical protein